MEYLVLYRRPLSNPPAYRNPWAVQFGRERDLA